MPQAKWFYTKGMLLLVGFAQSIVSSTASDLPIADTTSSRFVRPFLNILEKYRSPATQSTVDDLLDKFSKITILCSVMHKSINILAAIHKGLPHAMVFTINTARVVSLVVNATVVVNRVPQYVFSQFGRIYLTCLTNALAVLMGFFMGNRLGLRPDIDAIFTCSLSTHLLLNKIANCDAQDGPFIAPYMLAIAEEKHARMAGLSIFAVTYIVGRHLAPNLLGVYDWALVSAIAGYATASFIGKREKAALPEAAPHH
jgi:hypothetical protein